MKPQIAPNCKICIVMMSALGDTVHVLPVINALKRHEPTCRITWLLHPAGAALMRGHPAVDEIIECGRGIAALKTLRRVMHGRKFDLVLDLQVALKAGLATLAVPAHVKVGFDRQRARDANWLFTTHRIPPHAPQHVQDQYLEFLHYLGVEPEPLQWNLGPWPGEENIADHLLGSEPGNFVSLVLATTWKEKDWLPSRWSDLTARLHEMHFLPVLVGGNSQKEREIMSHITANSGVPLVNTLGCSLRELVAVLSSSQLVISPDTAPMHMAVALGVPVIGLMGYTNPQRVGPYEQFGELLVDEYWSAGEQKDARLDYRPGGMDRITVERVIEKVRLWMLR